MAIQGFDKEFYLNAKLAQLQSDSATAADWAGKDAAFLEARLLNGFGLTAEAHYEQYGYQEDLAPNAFFNPAEYIRAKATDMFNDPASTYLTIDEAAADFVAIWNGNVYNHYLQYGEEEGINPSNSFDVSGYYEAKLAQLQAEGNTEITTVEQVKEAFKAAGLTALEHFLTYGQPEEGLSAPAVPADEQVNVDTSVPGQVFTLTAGADTPATTSGDDTINALTINAEGAATTTLSAFDTIDGAAGTDTLNIYSDNTNNINHTFPATLSIKNVEIVNILNANAAAGVFGDASKYEGVEQLWQVGFAENVTKLAETTTAGFKNLTAATANDLTVTAAAAATSATIALDAVKGDATTNTAELNVAGAALTGVIVSGTIAQTDTAATDPAANLALAVTLAKDAQAATVNTAVKSTLTIENDGTSTKDLTSVDASASTGNITYTGADNKVATIKTGAGDDTVTVITATDNTVGAEINALVETGAGDDSINVNTTGSGKTTVNAGAGDDSITLTSGLNTATRVDGGEGKDTVKYAGKAFVAGDYALANSALSNVEVIEFTGTTAAVADVSKFTSVSEFVFAGNVGDKATEASAATLTTKGNLEAASTGYTADGADADSLTDAYGGDLNVTQTGTGTADLFAANANLTVKAGTAGVNSTVTGDVQALNVTLTNGADDPDAPTADTLTTVGIDVTGAENNALTSLILSGNGSATVVGGAKLATIDASDLGGTLAYGANAGNVTGGLTFTGDATVKETITLGSGADVVTANSTYGKMDTIIGFDSTKETNDGTSVTDTLQFAGLDTSLSSGDVASKVTLSNNATSLELAFVEAAAASASSTADTAGDVVTFQFGGNTYLFQDAAGSAGDGTDQGTLEDSDLAIEIVGIHDFSQDFDAYVA